MVYGISKNKDNIDTDGSEEIGKLGGCSPGVEYIYRSSCSEGQGMLVSFCVFDVGTLRLLFTGPLRNTLFNGLSHVLPHTFSSPPHRNEVSDFQGLRLERRS